MPGVPDQLALDFGLNFEDLYSRAGLHRLDGFFLMELAGAAPDLHAQLLAARANPAAIEGRPESELVIALAPHVEDFLGRLFGIACEVEALQARHNQSAPFFAFKRKFIQKRAISGVTKEQAAAHDGAVLALELESLFHEPLTERSFFAHVSGWIENESAHAAGIQIALLYAAWAALAPAGIERHRGDVLFKVAHKLDPLHLVPIESVRNGSVAKLRLADQHWRYREGFELTDRGMALPGALDQANYCIKCHNQSKDSCSTGLKDKTAGLKEAP